MVQSISPANPGEARPFLFAFQLRFEPRHRMRRVEALLAVAAALALAGCALRAKPTVTAAASPPKPVIPAAPPPAPAPLSIPQTNVQLPPPQPVNPDALVTEEQPEEPAGAPQQNHSKGRINTAP